MLGNGFKADTHGPSKNCLKHIAVSDASQPLHRVCLLTLDSPPAAAPAEIVRVGPNEIAFRSPQAMHDIYMATVRNRETFVKTEFQDLGGKEPGITAERDPEEHRKVAKQLVPAFSPRAMLAQEQHVHRYVDLLVQQLDKHGGTSSKGVDMREVR